jgi:hypothetical protein
LGRTLSSDFIGNSAGKKISSPRKNFLPETRFETLSQRAKSRSRRAAERAR